MSKHESEECKQIYKRVFITPLMFILWDAILNDWKTKQFWANVKNYILHSQNIQRKSAWRVLKQSQRKSYTSVLVWK